MEHEDIYFIDNRQATKEEFNKLQQGQMHIINEGKLEQILEGHFEEMKLIQGKAIIYNKDGSVKETQEGTFTDEKIDEKIDGFGKIEIYSGEGMVEIEGEFKDGELEEGKVSFKQDGRTYMKLDGEFNGEFNLTRGTKSFYLESGNLEKEITGTFEKENLTQGEIVEYCYINSWEPIIRKDIVILSPRSKTNYIRKIQKGTFKDGKLEGQGEIEYYDIFGSGEKSSVLKGEFDKGNLKQEEKIIYNEKGK